MIGRAWARSNTVQRMVIIVAGLFDAGLAFLFMAAYASRVGDRLSAGLAWFGLWLLITGIIVMLALMLYRAQR